MVRVCGGRHAPAHAVAYALSLGAELAEFQPQEDVRVCLDPDGHPFCFFVHQ